MKLYYNLLRSTKLGFLVKQGISQIPKNTHYRTIRTTHNICTETDLRRLSRSQADVSLSLAEHVFSDHPKDTNIVLSPASNGPTRDQILGFLKSKSIQELNTLSKHLVNHVFADGERLGGPRLSTANGVWVDQRLRLKSTFEEIVQNYYKAASHHVDFQHKAEEVREEVNGLIKSVIPPGSVDALTRLIFANTVYFKGAWKEKFDASLTKNREFFLLNGSSVKAPFMTSYKDQYISEFDGFKVLQLPYKQGYNRERDFSMYFYLPDAKDGLPDLLEKVGSESGFIENHLPKDRVEVGDFRIPKFKINFDFEASEVLKGLGVVLPFCQGGLTEMVEWTLPGEELYISGMFQKAFIEVNEKGTEAAAVTAFGFGGSCCPMMRKKLDFVADHPFLFVIRENVSGAVLFIGQLLNPTC